MPPARKPVMERLLARVLVDSNGCWIRQGALDKNGYGKIGRGGKYGGMTYTHRAAYQDRHGKTDLPLDHLCRVGACCNPDHLEAVTQRENVLRGEHPRIKVARTDVCPKGHAMAGLKNVKRDGRGGRRCRTCLNAWRRERYAGRPVSLVAQQTRNHAEKADTCPKSQCSVRRGVPTSPLT